MKRQSRRSVFPTFDELKTYILQDNFEESRDIAYQRYKSLFSTSLSSFEWHGSLWVEIDWQDVFRNGIVCAKPDIFLPPDVQLYEWSEELDVEAENNSCLLDVLIDVCWQRHWVIVIPPRVQVQELLVLDTLFANGAVKVSIVVGEGASISIALHDQYCHNLRIGKLLCNIKAGAHVSFVRLRTESGAINELISIRFILDDNAYLDYQGLVDNSIWSQQWLGLNLRGVQSHANVRSVVIGKQYNFDGLTVWQHHEGVKSTSIVRVRSILDDHAVSSYNGQVTIAHDAINTDALQENKTIILGEHARSYSRPALEVKTHEVRCAHGSAVGRIDDEMLFYLQSRAMSLSEARYLMLTGFLFQLLDNEMLLKSGTRGLRRLLQKEDDAHAKKDQCNVGASSNTVSQSYVNAG